MRSSRVSTTALVLARLLNFRPQPPGLGALHTAPIHRYFSTERKYHASWYHARHPLDSLALPPAATTSTEQVFPF
jgi:hypothetical protein